MNPGPTTHLRYGSCKHLLHMTRDRGAIAEHPNGPSWVCMGDMKTFALAHPISNSGESMVPFGSSIGFMWFPTFYRLSQMRMYPSWLVRFMALLKERMNRTRFRLLGMNRYPPQPIGAEMAKLNNSANLISRRVSRGNRRETYYISDTYDKWGGGIKALIQSGNTTRAPLSPDHVLNRYKLTLIVVEFAVSNIRVTTVFHI